MFKIVKSQEAVCGKKIETLRFDLKDLKPKVREVLDTTDMCMMYGFEEVFGVSSGGHGVGCGMEDIDFTIPKKKTGYKRPLYFGMTYNGREIKVVERLVSYDKKGNYVDSESISITPELSKYLKKTLAKRN